VLAPERDSLFEHRRPADGGNAVSIPGVGRAWKELTQSLAMLNQSLDEIARRLVTVVGDDGGRRVLCEWYDGQPMTGTFSVVALEARLSQAEAVTRMADHLRQQPRRRC
jgi:hypothetical protein